MLRMIIWADPSQKGYIINKYTSDKKGQSLRQKEIENKQVAIDPKYFFLFSNLITI